MSNHTKRLGTWFLLLAVAATTFAQTGSLKKLSEEIKVVQKQLVPDKRVAVLDIELKLSNDSTIIILGETDLPNAKAEIQKYLSNQNIVYTDSIILLPNSSLGDKTWALATLSVSTIHSKPDHTSELVSQVMMGTPLKVLDYKNKWYRIQTPENYIGWMDAGGLHRINNNELDHWKRSNRYFYNQLNGKMISEPNKKGEIISDLVLGDLFEVLSTDKEYLKIKTPDGREGYVIKKRCISYAEWSQISPSSDAILDVSKQMMGSPYLWGGLSSKAVDCSGLVKLVFYSQGVILARDASQQAKYGQVIDYKDVKNLNAGDLLFFGSSNQHITHVGIHISNGDFIHSSGRVHISSFVPNDPKYVATRNLVYACRVLNSLDSEGIISVKKHPWYSIQP